MELRSKGMATGRFSADLTKSIPIQNFRLDLYLSMVKITDMINIMMIQPAWLAEPTDLLHCFS